MVTGGAGWTAARRRAFLDHLSQHCNVAAACRAVGMDSSSAYHLRRRDAGFAAQWREALEVNYERLEAALLRYSIDSLGSDDAAEGAEDEGDVAARREGRAVRATDVQVAVQMLGRRREGAAPARAPSATRDETDAALRRQLDVLAKRLKRAREV